MKLRIILTCSVLLTSFSLLADPIDLEKAKILAAQFMSTSDVQPQLMKKAVRKQVEGRKLAPAYNDVAPYYIFSRGVDQGFVIVSGDDALPEVLGYTERGDFDEANLPPFLSWYLNHYGDMIESAQAVKAPRRAPVVSAVARTDIAPLISTHWDQGWPYNNLCPDRKDGGGKCLTGCVATAAAQVMYYWHKDLTDVTLSSTSSYTYGDQAKATKAFPKGTKLRWELMLQKYGTEPEEYRTAVATLMAITGGGAGLTYGSSTSGYPNNCIPVFQNIFGMNGGSHRYKDHGGADFVSDETWASYLYNDLVKKYPILYAGCRDIKDANGNVTSAEGHAIVIDGYQASTGFFHFNLGWGGQGDGYFTVARSKSPSWGFNDSYQEMVTGVTPKRQNLSVQFITHPKVYVNRPATFTLQVANNGTLDYSGLYIFANTTGKKPTSVSEAKSSDETVLSNDGKTVRIKLTAKPTTASKWYFIVTDKNLNVLAQHEVMAELPSSKLYLKNVNVESSTDTEVYEGQTYKVIYNTRATAHAEIEDRSIMGYEGSPRMAIYESADNGKTFKYVGYKYGKASIAPNGSQTIDISISSTSSCPISRDSLYYGVMLDYVPALRGDDDFLNKTLATDTIIRFVMREGDFNVSAFDGKCVKFSGVWDANRFVTLTKKSAYKEATTYDLTEVEKISEIPTLEHNLNAVFYVSPNSSAMGKNVIKNGVCAQLELTAGYNFIPSADFVAERAVFNLNMPACKWGLITVPCDLVVSSGIFARRIDSHMTSGISNRTTNVDTLLAGHTYLVLTSSYVKQQLQSVNTKVLKSPQENLDPAVVGSFVSTMTPAGALLINNDGQQYFDLVDEGTAVEAMRGYFLDPNVKKSFRAYSSVTVDPAYQTLAETIHAAYLAIAENAVYANSDATQALMEEIDSAEIKFTERIIPSVSVRLVYKELADMTQNYLTNYPNPDEERDYTDKIVNPSFESGLTGWTSDGVVRRNTDLTYKTIGTEGSSYLYNCKSDSTSTLLTQMVTGLPSGYYRLTAMVGTTEGHAVTLFAGDTAVTVAGHHLGIHYLSEGRIDDVFVDESGELEIGVKPGFFYKVDNFRLTLVTAAQPDILPEDVNGDGVVDTQDVLAVYSHMQASEDGADRADVNKDGLVDTQDALKVYEYMQNK